MDKVDGGTDDGGALHGWVARLMESRTFMYSITASGNKYLTDLCSRISWLRTADEERLITLSSGDDQTPPHCCHVTSLAIRRPTYALAYAEICERSLALVHRRPDDTDVVGPLR